jgi:hypothetical protein
MFHEYFIELFDYNFFYSIINNPVRLILTGTFHVKVLLINIIDHYQGNKLILLRVELFN